MCEWLSCREWCDVRLLCGGRSFSAHRAVLASASSFLRKLLLSCPDDSPTFIVLPDFDLEAVSSVLYYVYNGEVTIQKTKLKMFLDIVKEMKIFVDGQYLQEITKSNTENTENLHSESIESLKLGFTNDINQGIVFKTKHGQSDVTPQSAYKVRGYHTLHQDRSKTSISAHNMQSAHADRQRDSFLRDLFTETYPWNGNVNGYKGGVLAISNERYLAPTSVLLTNANGKQLGDKILPGSLGMGLATPSTAVCHPWTWKQFHENKVCTNIQNKNFDLKRITDMSTFQYSEKPECDNLLFNYFPKPKFQPVYKTDDICSKSIKGKNNVMPVEDCRNLKERHISRGAVLNKVMESPWCSRVPNNFKPFCKKNQEKQHQNLNIENRNMAKQEANDSNNNNVCTTKPIVTLGTTNDVKSITSITDTNETQIKCKIFNEKFSSSDLLTSLKRLHSGRYSCDQCSKTFSQLRNYKYHMSVHRGTREFAATCSVCGKYFNDKGYLSSHMKIHRNRKEYKCSQCPKSFNQRVAYNMHVRIHTGVKPHVCDQCGKAFSRKMLLKQHLRTHSGERPYACAHCDKRFADRSNMTLHLRLHTGVKPFSCPMCPKAFTKKHHLKSHLNFHTGAKPYSCPRCKLAFTQSSNMRTHYKKCSVEPKDGDSSVTT